MILADRYAWLDRALADGGVVVTASRRLARALRQNFDDARSRAGHKAWATPQIYAQQAWLTGLLDQSIEAPQAAIRLGEHAAARLWQLSLDEVARTPLPNRAGFVRHCVEAWSRCAEWCVTLDDITRHAQTPDEKLFARAAANYAGRLESGQYVDTAGLRAAATRLVGQGSVNPLSPLYFAGFDRVTPAMQRLVDALRTAGSDVEMVAIADRSSDIRCFSLPNPNAEFRAAGAWARKLLEQNPQQRIAIVCTDLQNDVMTAGHSVRDGFVPGWQYAEPALASAVNLSYGRRLPDYPAIAIALMLLRWTCESLSSQELSVLLRSPGFGPTDRRARAQLELELRRYPDRLWPPAIALEIWNEVDPVSNLGDWLQIVRSVSNFSEKYAGNTSPAAWADAFDSLLQGIGWPADDALCSAEFQLLNRWRMLLNEFAAMESVAPRIDLEDAVATVVRLATETLFQPESANARIDVLGVLETAGLQFDAIWVTGVDASRWPAAPNPLALVSRRLQREFGMPDASPVDTLAFSNRVFDRLLNSAKTVVVSWPRLLNDVETAPSELLTDLITATQDTIADPGRHASRYIGFGNLEDVAPDPAPPLAPSERIQGGAGTVQRQYTDPFSAFAYGRLGLRELQRFEPGVTPRIRGIIVHRALRTLMADTPNLQELVAWTEEELEKRVSAAAAQAVRAHFRLADSTMQQLLRLETERLHLLLAEFVEIERETRAPFSVDAVERQLQYSHAGITLDLQIDRIDRLDDGSNLIIDYKTGAGKTWVTRQGEPAELQLVVYACAWPETVGGLALINVDRRQIVYRGIGSSTQWHRDKGEDWQQQLPRWEQLVRAALENIAAGDARVNISLGSDRTRPLAILSRIEELRRGS